VSAPLPPPPLAKGLAKRIDRLALRAHAFHRFAHHPLCDAYRGEVFRIGKRLRLCKGCSLLVAGFLLGIGLGALWRPSASFGLPAWAVAVLVGITSLRRRLPKLIARLVPGLGIGFAAWAGWPYALLSLATIIACWTLYRHRGPERSHCGTCHERDRKPCSGFVLIVRRERAFQRKAGHLIDRHRRGLRL
jgi:4-amino-4-deoxy-L-arabinose transferase-like glycosyltransferase